MNVTIPTSEILNRAADRIEKRGLWKGGEEGGTCAANAIAAVSEGIELAALRHRTLNALVVHLGADDGASYRTIWTWNDAPGRTASEVIETLRACAVIEASRESQPAVVSA